MANPTHLPTLHTAKQLDVHEEVTPQPPEQLVAVPLPQPNIIALPIHVK